MIGVRPSVLSSFSQGNTQVGIPRRSFMPHVIFLAIALLALQSQAQTYFLQSSVFGAGGGSISGATYSTVGTVGEFDASLEVTAGFATASRGVTCGVYGMTYSIGAGSRMYAGEPLPQHVATLTPRARRTNSGR